MFQIVRLLLCVFLRPISVLETDHLLLEDRPISDRDIPDLQLTRPCFVVLNVKLICLVLLLSIDSAGALIGESRNVLLRLHIVKGGH